jgi:glyoxylase-like metal-dependent hydrolase (beta-lactamase superfamily II)
MAGYFTDKIHVLDGQAGPVYIIADTDAITLIDVGFPSDAKSVIKYVENTLKRNISQIKLIVITHSHFDHISGVDYLMKKVDAYIAAHTSAEKYLTGKKALPVTSFSSYCGFLLFLFKNGFPLPSLRDIFSMPWAGIPGIKKGVKSEVKIWLEQGKAIPGLPGWEVFHTPGHTDDGICLYHPEEKILFSGDTIINDKGVLKLSRLLVWDSAALQTSFKKINQLQVNYLLPGWGPPVKGNDILRDVR